MKVKVSENGIEREIHIEDIKVGDSTLGQILASTVGATNEIKRVEESNKAREARLSKIWERLK